MHCSLLRGWGAILPSETHRLQRMGIGQRLPVGGDLFTIGRDPQNGPGVRAIRLRKVRMFHVSGKLVTNIAGASSQLEHHLQRPDQRSRRPRSNQARWARAPRPPSRGSTGARASTKAGRSSTTRPFRSPNRPHSWNSSVLQQTNGTGNPSKTTLHLFQSGFLLFRSCRCIA